MLRRVVQILILLSCVHASPAQPWDASKFRHYTIQDGLTDNNVIDIKQDSTGYMWIATHHGLTRFDGNIFKSFLKSSRYNSIPDNTIYSMDLFHDQLAIATNDGAQIISTKTLEQKNLFIPTSDALRYWSNACEYVRVDQAGNYGVSTKTGLYVFSPKGQLKKRFDYYTDKDIGHSWMMFGSHLFESPDGNMLQRNRTGLFIYDRQRNYIGDASAYFPASVPSLTKLVMEQFPFFFISSSDLIAFNLETNSFDLINFLTGETHRFPASFNIRQEINWQTRLFPISENLWAFNSRNGGFFLLQVDEKNSSLSSQYKRFFEGHFCNAIFSDSRRRLWIGTDEGLYMQDIRPAIINSFSIIDEDPTNPLTITSLLVDHDQIIAGTDKKLILVIDKRQKKVIRRIQLAVRHDVSNEITYFQPVRPDTIWISSASGLNWMNTRNFSTGTIDLKQSDRETRSIEFLYADSKNNIWIPPTVINTIFRYDYSSRTAERIDGNNDKLFKTNTTNSIAEDSAGNLWFGGDAIARWNPHLKKVDTLIDFLSTQKNRKKGFLVMSDSRGDIWVMLNDDGFARITNVPVHVRPENILADNRGFYPTSFYDKIFVTTTNGLAYLDLKSLKAIIFHPEDGLPSRPISSLRFAPDSSDRSIWFACGNIICTIPTSASSIYRQPPKFAVSEIAVINDTVVNYPPATIRLTHTQNDLRLWFSAINYIDPENMRFAYRIRNRSDSAWIEAGNQPNILLTNISPGKYALEAKVYAFDNKWPEQVKEMNIIIEPPFWNTWWFYIIAALGTATCIYLVYRYRIAQVRNKARIDRQMAEYEIKALHAQMNPHFVFNCLNSIKEMILHDEKQNASRYLSKFAQLIRTNLDESRQGFITVKQCIDHLEQYIEMEKIRFDQFNYKIDTEAGLALDARMAPMIVQPLVENAIWHGLKNRAGEKNLNIRFCRSGVQLVCEIDDNGIGIIQSQKNKLSSKPAHRSMGITNIEERIAVLNEKYKMNCSLSIRDKSELLQKDGSGTLAILKINM